jgi:hypothetical protein
LQEFKEKIKHKPDLLTNPSNLPETSDIKKLTIPSSRVPTPKKGGCKSCEDKKKLKIFKQHKKVIVKNFQCPGDIVMLTGAVRDLKKSHPDVEVDIRTSCTELWENNPYITSLDEKDQTVISINAEYPLIHQSNEGPWHFIHGFRKYLEDKLDLDIPATKAIGDIHISPLEASWYSAIYEELGKDVPYWVVDAGYKKDFTCKQWDFSRWQKIIDDFPEITFVQIGLDHEDHIHPKLKGNNLINLIGKTDNRQLVRLVYNAFGVLTPVSFPMVLAYSIPPHPRFKRKSRACIVVSGGREPNHWQQAPNQQFVHTCGMLPCCDNGGCWKSRVIPLNDNDHKNNSLCVMPIKLKSGQTIPKCMDMITAEQITQLIKLYMDNLEYECD